METIKSDFDLALEEIQKNKQTEAKEDNQDMLVFDGIDLNIIFEEIENSLETYRLNSDKKYNDSKKELANTFLSV